jgi:hypothetical protein
VGHLPGGGADDFGDDIAVDGAGNVFICGGTLSANFPTAGTPLQRLHGGAVDGFLARLGPSGSSLSFATFWGGNQADRLFQPRSR